MSDDVQAQAPEARTLDFKKVLDYCRETARSHPVDQSYCGGRAQMADIIGDMLEVAMKQSAALASPRPAAPPEAERNWEKASVFIRGVIEAIGYEQPKEKALLDLDSLLACVVGTIEELKTESAAPVMPPVDRRVKDAFCPQCRAHQLLTFIEGEPGQENYELICDACKTVYAAVVPPVDTRLTADDIDTIVDGIDNFIIGPQYPPDPELVELWQPFIDKLKALKPSAPGGPHGGGAPAHICDGKVGGSFCPGCTFEAQRQAHGGGGQ